ncbi:MAG: GerAB/ArcD/ProY family transporter [Bacilli bacterium]|nr:GerAB/ArcD/ProY family transporter [Bacilli bacterium]
MKDRINLLEFCTTFYMVIASPFLGIGLYNLLKVANIDSTISIIIAYLLSFIILFLYIKVNNYKEDMNLKEKIDNLFSKGIAKIIAIVLSICIFIMMSTLSYNLNSFVISQFLSETPIIIIGIIIGILVIYVNKKGIETIMRTANLLFFITCILMLIGIFGEYNKVEYINLHPILIEGIYRPIKGSLYIILINTVYAFLLLIVPKKNIVNNKHINLGLFITITFVFIIFMIVVCYTIGSLGIDLATLYHYPAYIVMKEISIFEFIDKIENFVIILWIFEIFITLSLSTYFINKMTNIEPYIIVITSLILYISFFKNSTFFNYFASKYIPILSIIVIIIMLVICIKILYKEIKRV